MSNTTPESPNGAPDHDVPDSENEVAEWDNGVVDPPSDPVPATGHVSAPVTMPDGATEPALSAEVADSDSVAPVAFSSQDVVNVGSEPTGSSTPSSAPADVPPIAFTGDIPEAEDATPVIDIGAPIVDAATGQLASTEPQASPGAAGSSESSEPTASVYPAADGAENPDRSVVATPVAEPVADQPVVPVTREIDPGSGVGAGIAPAATVLGGVGAGAAAGTLPPTAAYGQAVAPIYVSAPLPPKKKHNRTFGLIVSLIGTAVFAIVYAAAVAVIGLVQHSSDNFLDEYTNYLGTASFYVPIILFFVAMVLLILILNRAGWWAYIIGGFFVAVVVYFAFIAGALLQVAGQLTASEATRFVNTLWLNPFGIAGGIVAREVSIWIGLWLAARGRKLKVRNAEAREEYERTLLAGPQQNTYPPTA